MFRQQGYLLAHIPGLNHLSRFIISNVMENDAELYIEQSSMADYDMSADYRERVAMFPWNSDVQTPQTPSPVHYSPAMQASGYDGSVSRDQFGFPHSQVWYPPPMQASSFDGSVSRDQFGFPHSPPTRDPPSMQAPVFRANGIPHSARYPPTMQAPRFNGPNFRRWGDVPSSGRFNPPVARPKSPWRLGQPGMPPIDERWYIVPIDIRGVLTKL